jgi:hypothetical protein
MQLSNSAVTAAVVLAFAAMTHAPLTHAVAINASNATGSCQGNLPASDTNIRKRPLAIKNEGGTASFVSCSVTTPHNPESVDNAVVYLTNTNASPVDVSCTFVDGPAAALATFHPQTLTLDPGIFTAMLWEPEDFQLTTFSIWANFTCNLPPGVEINIVGHDFTDAV